MTHEPLYFFNNSSLGVSIVCVEWKLNPSCVWSYNDLLCLEHRFIISHFFWHFFFHLFPGSSHCQCTCINIAAVFLFAFFCSYFLFFVFFNGGVFHFLFSSSVLIINAYTLWGRHYIFHWNEFSGGLTVFFFGSSDVIFYFG